MIPVFVINLGHRPDRRQAMREQLARVGLVPQFFPAIDGRALNREAVPALREAGELSDGEVGCHLSHLGVWREIAARGVDRALVLEDDVLLSAALLGVLEQLTPQRLRDIDVVRLSSLMRQVGKPLVPLADGFSLWLPTKSPSGLQGYVVTARGARRLVDAFSVPRLAVDTAVDGAWQHGVQVVMVAPPVIHHDVGAPSSIEITGRRRPRRPDRGLAKWAASVRKQLTLSGAFQKLTGRRWGAYWRTRTVSGPHPSG
jgi:glycosyl transferase family 25